MTTLKAATKAYLQADATLSALATGGIFDTQDVGRRGLTLDNLRTGASVAISPAIFLRWTTSTRVPYEPLKAREEFVHIFFYQDVGHDVCEQMRNRVYELLNQKTGQNVPFDEPPNQYVNAFIWTDDLREKWDEGMNDTPFERSRYQVDIVREVYRPS